jgi:hypothetical protein
VANLRTILVDLQTTLAEELRRQTAGPVTHQKAQITLSGTEGLAALHADVAARTESKAYLRRRQPRVDTLLERAQQWFLLASPNFSPRTLSPELFLPVVDRVNTTGNPGLAQDLETALAQLADWNPMTPVYTGSLTPASTTQPPALTGKTGPFVFPAPASLVLHGGTTEEEWVMVPATPPSLAVTAVTQTYAAGACPTLLMEVSEPLDPVFTTVVLAGFTVVSDGAGLVLSAHQFGDLRTGMFLRIDGLYYEVAAVFDDATAGLRENAPAGSYADSEIHRPGTFPLTYTYLDDGVLKADACVVDLGGFGEFSPTAVSNAIKDAVQLAFCTVTSGPTWVRLTVDTEHDAAGIFTTGSPTNYPAGYDVVNILPGQALYGTTDTSAVTVVYRDETGAILTAAATLTGTLSPAAAAAALEPQLTGICAVAVAGGRLTFTGLLAGAAEFLRITFRGVTQRGWGLTPELPAPAAPFVISYPAGNLLGPYAVTSDGTNTLLLPESPAATPAWVAEVQLTGEKHWAAYVITDVTDNEVTLAKVPAPFGEVLSVRLVHRPLLLQNLDPDAAAELTVDDTPTAAVLGLNGQTDDGETTEFLAPAGVKDGYVLRREAGDCRVVRVQAGVMTLDTAFPTASLTGTIFSPGALSMAVYTQLAATGLPFTMTLERAAAEAAQSKVAALLAQIDDPARYPVAVGTDFTRITAFCADRKLEVLSSLLLAGSLRGFFAAEAGSLRRDVSAGDYAWAGMTGLPGRSGP